MLYFWFHHLPDKSGSNWSLMLCTSVINTSLISSLNRKSAISVWDSAQKLVVFSRWNEGFSCLQKVLKNVLFCATWTWYRFTKKKKKRKKMGGAVTLWLVRSSPERAVRVRAGDTVLCSWARHLTLTVPLSTQEYKWVPANCWRDLTNCGEWPAID